MNTCKVSVLVAVYNSERFLQSCLNSLLSQQMTDFEAICIDDGSTDGSLEILKSYAARDTRFRIITIPQNSGQARARNAGLRVAKGDYVCMLDSDDWLADDALQQVIDAFERTPTVDAVLFRLVYANSDGSVSNEYSMDDFDTLPGKTAFELSLSWRIHGVYAIRTDIHKQIPYDTRRAAYSDDNTTRLHFLACRTVALCDGRYYYRQHEGSVTHQTSEKRFLHLLAAMDMKDDLASRNVDEKSRDIYENALWLVLIDTYYFLTLHRAELGKAVSEKGLLTMRDAWEKTDVKRLTKKQHKFGYRHLCCWSLFRLQEELYFFLKKIKSTVFHS